MAERTSHDAGTISWTDLATTDQDAAKAFYAGLFGWEYDDQPIDEDTIYSMAKLGGRIAAAISPQQPDESAAGIPPHWNVYVTVDDVDADERQGRRGRRHRAGGPVRRDRRRAACRSSPTRPARSCACGRRATSIGAEVVNEPGALAWADTATTDAEAAQAFYGALLGWSFDADERGAAVLGDLERRAVATAA